MTIILNSNNPELVLRREVKKPTSRSIHTSNGEVLKFSDGWREATNAEKMRMGASELVR